MKRYTRATWGFVLVSMVNMAAGIIPALKGESLNVPFFVIGMTFLMLAIAIESKAQKPPGGPD